MFEQDNQIIKELGGVTKAAAALGVNSPQCVWNWKKRGIPEKIKNKFPHIFANKDEVTHEQQQ